MLAFRLSPAEVHSNDILRRLHKMTAPNAEIHELTFIHDRQYGPFPIALTQGSNRDPILPYLKGGIPPYLRGGKRGNLKIPWFCPLMQYFGSMLRNGTVVEYSTHLLV